MNTNTFIVVSLLGSLLSALVSAISAYVVPQFPWIWQVSLGVAAVLFVAYIVLDRASLGELFSKRTTRYGLNAGVMALLAAGIVVFINLIANDHDWKTDITKNKLHTLSDESLKVLKGLKTEVVARVFVDPRMRQEYDTFFERYSYANKNFKVEHIDIDKEPMVIEKYKIKSPGVVIVETANRTARIENISGPDDSKLEEKLTNAIIQVTRGDKKKIYFVTGHGERMIGDTGSQGYSDMKETLEGGRYKVEELITLQREHVPSDTEILVVAGPKSDFMEYELKSMDEFLKRGGKILFMLKPNSSPKLKPFLAQYGVDWKPKKTVLEENPVQRLAGGNPLYPIVTHYDMSHDITRDARQISLFPIATPIEKMATPPAGDKLTALFTTSPQSLEVDMVSDTKIKVDQKTDRKGPLTLALAVTGPAPTKVIDAAEKSADSAKNADQKDKTKKEKEPGEASAAQEFRMVVVGDSDFASNGVVKTGINSDLFQNMLSWLAHEEDLISIRPRPTDVREFDITDSRARIINVTVAWFLPITMLITGMMVWASRRRR